MPERGRGGAKALLESLFKPSVRSILIKGEPGTGKTTLAIELLRMYGRGIYILTRVSEEKISEQYPSIKDLVEKGRILELHPDLKAAKFEDLRLGTVTDIVESIIRGVKMIEKPLIILDSWDALAKEVDYVERLKTEKSILAITEANDSRVVFVSEEPELTTTDYLVDAIIELKDELMNGKRIRRMMWKKLRGSPIPQPSYLFTLADGRFTIFGRTRIKFLSGDEAKEFEPIKHTKGYYSTGSEDLDLLIRRIKEGSVIVLELGAYVDPTWHIPMITSLICNFLANGDKTIIVPSGGVTPDMIKKAVELHISKSVIESSLRIGHYEELKPDPCFFKLDPSSASESYGIVEKEVDRVEGKLLVIMGADLIEYIHGFNGLTRYASVMVHKIREKRGLLIFIVKHGTKIKEPLLDICDAYLKLDELYGALVDYSIKPPSGLCNHVRL